MVTFQYITVIETMIVSAGRVRWALYRDKECSDAALVLSDCFPIEHVQPLKIHAAPNPPDIIQNPTGIHLTPDLHRQLQNLLDQLRAGNGHCSPLPMLRNEAIPVVVENLTLGSRAVKLGLDGKATLYCKLELESSDFIGKDTQDTDWFSWKIERASDYRMRGNEAFKLNKYKTAISLYKRALKWLEPPVHYSEEESKQVRVVAVACYANMAACYSKMKGDGNANRCIAAASNALKLDYAHVKSRYRRSLAYVLLKEFTLAVADLTELCKLEPENMLFQSILMKAQAAKTQLRKKQQKAFANLFDENKEGNTI
ncbi:putative tetratricopeptide-like helical domain superfamily [Plasmopara halstedii]